MKISLLVLGAPFDNQCAYSAFKYCEAALKSGQSIHRVFFYQSAVHAGSKIASPPQDEFDLYKAWQDLKANHSIELIVCIAAAARRGINDESEAKRHNKDTHNLSDAFELSGLGQLVEAQAVSDRFITFGK